MTYTTRKTRQITNLRQALECPCFSFPLGLFCVSVLPRRHTTASWRQVPQWGASPACCATHSFQLSNLCLSKFRNTVTHSLSHGSAFDVVSVSPGNQISSISFPARRCYRPVLEPDILSSWAHGPHVLIDYSPCKHSHNVITQLSWYYIVFISVFKPFIFPLSLSLVFRLQRDCCKLIPMVQNRSFSKRDQIDN